MRVTVRKNGPEQRWFFQGRLTIILWQRWRRIDKHRESIDRGEHRIVDLDGMTIVDKSGEQVLSTMLLDGAEFMGYIQDASWNVADT